MNGKVEFFTTSIIDVNTPSPKVAEYLRSSVRNSGLSARSKAPGVPGCPAFRVIEIVRSGEIVRLKRSGRDVQLTHETEDRARRPIFRRRSAPWGSTH
jgi:hypothetical protein